MGKTTRIITGTAIAAAVAAAVTIFFTSTKKGQETTEKIKDHAVNLGQKISYHLQKTKKISKSKYDEIVEKTVNEYAADKKLAKNVAGLIKKDLKKRWSSVEKHVKSGKK